MADFDRRIANATDTLSRDSLDRDEHPADDPLIDRMVRVPTEEDFEDVLTPEGLREAREGLSERPSVTGPAPVELVAEAVLNGLDVRVVLVPDRRQGGLVLEEFEGGDAVGTCLERAVFDVRRHHDHLTGKILDPGREP